jgi:hypothetical protein
MATCFVLIKTSSGQYFLYEGTLIVCAPSCNKYWPEDGLMKPKHVAITMYYWLYMDVVLWMNKILYEYDSPLLLLRDGLVYPPLSARSAGRWLAHLQWRLGSYGTEIYPQSWKWKDLNRRWAPLLVEEPSMSERNWLAAPLDMVFGTVALVVN